MIKKILIIAVIFIALYAITNSLGLNEAMLEFISKRTDMINSFTQKSPLLSMFLFFCTYVILLTVGFPMGAIMAMVGGFFYSYVDAVFLTLFSAVVSAMITFFLGKNILYAYLKKKYKNRVEKIENAIKDDGAYYVLAVRVSSVLPFFWVNLLFGAANLSYKKYFLPTLVGLLPGTMVYVNIGESLSSLNSLRDVFSFKIALSFLLLGLLAILPVVIKKLKKR